MSLHPLRPLLKGDVTHKSSDRHTSPHGPAMDVWLTSIIRLAPSKDDLKTKAPIRDRRDSDSQRMYILPVIFLMPICKLFSNPALKVRNVAG
jgi:hypothetical protein